MSLVTRELETLAKYASNEHKQRVHLQEQLEALARQHSQLEQAAFWKGNAVGMEQPRMCGKH